MNRIYISLESVPEKSKKLNYTSVAVSFLMNATGICRLFNEETVREFLYRLTILLWPTGIANSFFEKDVLFRYGENKILYEVTIFDIINNLGLEITDYYQDCITREEWITSIAGQIRGAYSSVHFKGTVLTDKNKVGVLAKSADIDAKDAATVELVTNSAFNTIKKEDFIDLSKRISNRNKELKDYRKLLEKNPVLNYDFRRIPRRIKMRLFNHLASELNLTGNDFIHVCNDSDSIFGLLVHLAWLWANGYVEVEEITMGPLRAFTARVDPRIDFDYGKYDGLDKQGLCGFNLYDTYYDFRLDKVSYLLKVNNQEDRKPK